MNKSNAQFGIVLVSHGELAEHYLATLEHVLGKLDQVATISVSDSDDRIERQEKIRETVKSLDTGNGVVIATDVFGATPSNLAFASLHNSGARVLYGINIPTLLKLTQMRSQPIDQALEKAIERGRQCLNYKANQGNPSEG